MADLGSTLGDLGGAVSDIFGAEGALTAASAYTKAANIAKQNAAIATASGQIQEQQEQIATYKAIGTEQADTASAGFNIGSGSAGDLLRASAQQASLSNQLIKSQAEITANGFAQQATAYQGQAAAAKTQSSGGFLGGLLKVAGAALPFL